MSQPERFDIRILGSGKSGKMLAWHTAQLGGGRHEKLAFAKERAGDDRNADKAACPNREAFFAGRNQVPRGRHASTWSKFRPI
jgi:hypothetical protein